MGGCSFHTRNSWSIILLAPLSLANHLRSNYIANKNFFPLSLHYVKNFTYEWPTTPSPSDYSMVCAISWTPPRIVTFEMEGISRWFESPHQIEFLSLRLPPDEGDDVWFLTKDTSHSFHSPRIQMGLYGWLGVCVCVLEWIRNIFGHFFPHMKLFVVGLVVCISVRRQHPWSFN